MGGTASGEVDREPFGPVIYWFGSYKSKKMLKRYTNRHFFCDVVPIVILLVQGLTSVYVFLSAPDLTLKGCCLELRVRSACFECHLVMK